MEPTSSADYKRHRLPTQSLAAALASQLDPEQHKGFSSGSESLNRVLGNGGLERGKLLEICGPPGSGKTTIALDLVVDAVSKGEQVCWIDTLSQCPTHRLASVLADKNIEDGLDLIRHYQITSVAHFFALMIHSMDNSAKTSLMIIDNISSMFIKEFQASSEISSGNTSLNNKNVNPKDKVEKQSEKRARLITEIANGLQRFAAARSIAVVVLNQLTTRGSIGGGPLELAPSVNSANQTWSNAFHNRILLLRKHVPRTNAAVINRHLRFVFVLKSSGVEVQSTNLNRPDQFFVIKTTKYGVEDEKEHVFHSSGTISFSEAFGATGEDEIDVYYNEFSEGELALHEIEGLATPHQDTSEEVSVSDQNLASPTEPSLKRKRSIDEDLDVKNKLLITRAEVVAPIEENGSTKTSPAESSDQEHIAEQSEPAEVERTTFPKLSQELGTSQDASRKTSTSDEVHSPNVLHQRELVIPDSEGEDDDDVLLI